MRPRRVDSSGGERASGSVEDSIGTLSSVRWTARTTLVVAATLAVLFGVADVAAIRSGEFFFFFFSISFCRCERSAFADRGKQSIDHFQVYLENIRDYMQGEKIKIAEGYLVIFRGRFMIIFFER